MAPDDKDDTPQDIFALNLTMETDLVALSALRDQLALALTTLEQNTARVQEWLKQNRTAIIVTRHKLTRNFVIRPDAQAALRTVTQDIPADILGFLLQDPQVLQDAEKAYGDNHAIVQKLKAHAAGLPAHLIEALPEIKVGDNILRQLNGNTEATPQDPAPEQKKGGISSWFQSKAQRDAAEAEDTYRGMVGHWRQLQRDLVGLQSDRHYYVDSFMDWVGENLSPTDPAQDLAAILKTYRHPSYMLQRAQEDYNEVLKLRATALLDGAGTYSALAAKIDTQDITGFIQNMPDIFPLADTDAAQELRRMLLADFGCRSFAHLAISVVKDPADKFELLKAAFAFEGKAQIAAVDSKQEHYSVILDQVMHHDLPVDALHRVLDRLKPSRDELLAIIAETGTFAKLAERFGKDEDVLADALDCLLTSLQHPRAEKLAQSCAALQCAIRDANTGKIESTIAHLDHINLAADARMLWDLCTGRHFPDALRHATGQQPEKAPPLLAAALRAGLAREIVAHKDDCMTAYGQIAGIFDRLLPSLAAKADATALRTLLAGSRIAQYPESRDRWRRELGGANGRIARLLAQEDIGEASTLELLAMLLSPLSRRDASALLLATAADIPAHARMLCDCADSLTGAVTHLADGSLLLNPQNITNIWYRGDNTAASVRYFTDGTEHAGENGTLPDAAALIELFVRRHGFAPEAMGAYQPEMVDIYTFNSDGETVAAWAQGNARLSIDSAERQRLQSLPAFIHGDGEDRDGNTCRYAYHPRRVVALIPYGDQWVLIDRGGEHRMLQDVTLPPAPDGFVKLGAAFIQPELASILTRDDAAQSLKLRIEHRDLPVLLKEMAGDPALAVYVQDEDFLQFAATDDAQWLTLLDALQKAGGMLQGKGAFADFFFNLSVLGLVTAYQDGNTVGLQFGGQGRFEFRNRVEIEEDSLPELFQALLESAESRNALVIHPDDEKQIPVAVDADKILNVFYNAKEKRLEVLTEHDSLSFTVSAENAKTIMSAVEKIPGFADVGTRGQGADLLRLDRVTRLSTNLVEGRVQALTGNRVIPLGKTPEDFAKWSVTLLQDSQRPTDVKYQLFAAKVNYSQVPALPGQTAGGTAEKLAERLIQTAPAPQAAKKEKATKMRPPSPRF